MRPSKFFPMPSVSRLLPIAVLLFLCFLLTAGEARAQAPDDHGDTPADATPIVLGTTATGLISPGGDVDVFRFEITGASVDVWIYTRGGIDDTIGDLYDGNGRQIASGDDSDLSDNPFHFYIGENLDPGTYYIEVSGYDTTTGPYSLHTRTGADQGGTVDTAADLTLDDPVEGIIGTEWEEDVYKIDLSTANGPTDVVLYTTSAVDTVGEILDENFREVAYGDDSILSDQSSNFFLGAVLEPGVYYIFVSGYLTSTGPYRLHSWTGTDQAGSRATSAILSPESEQLGIIGSSDDEDYFRITVSNATDLQVYAEGPVDTVGELLDSSGNRLAYNDDSDFSLGSSSFFIGITLSAGTYYIAVSSLAEETGPYRLAATETVDQSNETDTAEELEPGTAVLGLIDPGADADLFKLEITDAAEVFIYTTGDVDTVGTLIDSDGATIGTDDDNGAHLNFFIRKNLEPGTYYIHVESYLSETGPYALFAEPAPPFSLLLGTGARGTIAEGYDEDYYKIEIAGATDAWIFALGSLDTVGTLYDSNLNEIAFNDDSLFPLMSRNFHFRETLDAGTYYLKVGSFNQFTGTYTVHVLPVNEPRNDRTSAASLAIGDPTPGTIGPDGQDEYFRVDFTERANVYILGISVSGDPVEAEVLDSNGNSVGVNQRVSYGQFDFYIRDTFGPGTYYVKVAASLGARVPYTILVLNDRGYTAFVAGCTAETAGLTDPLVGDDLYACQWHLKNREDQGKDIDVEPVWEEGITGEGVNVVVVDNGIDQYHEDLAPNIHAPLNHDYTGRGDIYDPVKHHGTAVAGIIAARDNNVGVRGVAPRATIHGHNYLIAQSDFVLADSMTRNRVVTAVSNNSWGPTSGPGLGSVPRYWELAVEKGVQEGYDGKGTFYAFAAGNSALDGADLNLNEHANFYAVTGVCAVNDRDRRSDYSDWGAPLWICAPSLDTRGSYRGIVTTENSDRYSYLFGGTSAAAPIVSGVAALLRDANPDLTWRDLKLVLAASARKNDPGNPGWEDGAFEYGSTTERYHFNHEYGFGMVDAKGAVDLGKSWTTVPPLETVEAESGNLNTGIPDLPSSGFSRTVTHTLSVNTGIEFIEFVEVRASFAHPSFRDLEIELVSPSGTTSNLLRNYDSDDLIPLNGEFRLGSAKHLGENPNGLWTLRVTDKIDNDRSGSLESWTIKVYGHMLTPTMPTLDAVTPSGGSLNIAWTAPAVSRGTGVASYDLRYIPTTADETDNANWTVVEDVWTASPGGNLEHVLTGLVGNTRYDVQVRAVNSAGAGAWSETATGTPTVLATVCLTGGALATLAGGTELASDCDALLALRDTLAGSAPLNWSAGLAFDQWDGVTVAFPVGGGQRRVTKLELGGKSLTGRIPSSFGNLAGLEVLDLSNNSLTGTIPAELGSLTGLTELSLNGNGLKGRIPTELGNTASLRVLDLSENRLNGPIPVELGTLINLTELRLHRNRLDGSIPTELGGLTNLTALRLDDNSLSGSIPAELSRLTRLQVLDLSQNELTGDVPTGLDNLTGLRQLVLAGNDLSGAIPSTLGTRLTRLESLDFSENGLTGEIPNRLTYITGLVELGLSENMLSGNIPSDMQFLRNLEKLFLNDNQFAGAIPEELRHLDKLVELSLSQNQLTGCIPKELRDTLNNDLTSLGLPYCDVLLSSLTVSGATLVSATAAAPGFDPAMPEYTAVAGPTQVTVTPIGEPGVTFKYVDSDFEEIPDADPEVDGYQIDLDPEYTKVHLIVISADGRATHTYSIGISRAGMPDDPVISSVAAGAASLDVAWTAPANTGGGPIVSYDLRYIETDAPSKTDDDWTVVAGASMGALTSVVRGLSASIEHDVQVRAFNGAHYSPWSATSTGTPDVGACSTGRAVTAVVTDPAANPGLVADCEALLAVEDSLEGIGTLNWSVDLSMRAWQGVTLGGTPERVTGLDRSEEELSDPIPSSLDRLTGLQTLDLSDNELTGTIPSRIGNLTGLETLGLGGNELTGEIPSSLSGLTALETLDLNDNKLEGEIPSWIGSLTNLEKLSLNKNRLTGPVPSWLNDLTSLAELRLDDNLLDGGIPSLASLTGLTVLHLQENGLTGSVPSWLGGLTMLEEVDLSENGLAGTIPLSLGAVSEQSGQPNLINLSVLHLHNNTLTGSVPAWLGNLPGLERIGLGGNQLTGDIPPELGDLAKLEYLDLAGNELTGSIPGKLAGLGNSSRLGALLLGGNQLTGSIPAELGDLGLLEQLDLSENQLSGEIPAGLGNLTNLLELYLDNNVLTGELPAGLGSLTALTVLDVQENRLTGRIPAGLGNLTDLEEVRTYSNQLTGEIPSLRRLVNLKVLLLYDNELTGPIPSWLGNLTELVELDICSNQLTGPIPPSLGNLAMLEELYLANNPLVGPIPSQLGNLVALETLDLRYNQLTGEPPAELGKLRNLERLYLSGNELTGPVPSWMEGFLNLRHLFLDLNRFTGQIPSWLGNLSDLEALFLFQNQFTGCIPHDLRGVPMNDLDGIDLVHCDVLLSGLSISPGTLTPQFDPYHTDYTASASASRITVTPANEYSAAFRFLDADDAEVPDADSASDGHQIDLAAGGATIKVEVVSQDLAADNTYTVIVTLEDVISRYDRDGNGAIDREEAIAAVVDYFADRITKEEAIEVILFYFAG